MRAKRITAAALLVCLCLLSGCMKSEILEDVRQAEKPEIPASLTINADGVPLLKVYDINTEKSENMDIETYVQGVLAGEMKNDWPDEALKAQAVLARTFVLRFIETKDSMYGNADISTDITEAQAYAEGLINEKIRSAVEETRGMVASYKGELINAWFHAHSGGVTELPMTGLEYKENPPYTQSVKSADSTDAPDDVENWTAQFPAGDVEKAAKELGVTTGGVTSVEIGKKGESGRAATIIINGKEVSAAGLRIRLGSEKLKSTFLTDIVVENDTVRFAGKGYGHGVGMSQWGAYSMAESGFGYEQIIKKYFKDVDIVKIWP